MGRKFGGLATAFALAAAVFSFSASASDTPTALSPSGNWNVDFAPNKCRLARIFGEGENRHLLFIEQYWPGKHFGLTVSGPGLKRWHSRARTKLQFSSEREPFTTEPFKGDTETFGPAMIYSSVSLENGTQGDEQDGGAVPFLDTELANTVEFIELRQGGKALRLDTGPLGEAFEVLNRCTEDLLRDWGLDAEKLKTATRRPTFENKRSVVRQILRTYPAAALNRGEQGIFRMRALIDENGKVTDCVINEATTADRLESPACKAMRKARFSPALDASGEPIPSYYATSITYRIGR